MPAGAATCTGHTCSTLRRIAVQLGSAGEKPANSATLVGAVDEEEEEEEDDEEEEEEAAAAAAGSPSCLRRRCSFQCALE